MISRLAAGPGGAAPPPADAAADDLRWYDAPRAVYSGGNHVRLLAGGDQLFPAMCEAIDAATDEIWLATYIFHDDAAARAVADALAAAARRGVRTHVVVDGFGSKASLPALRAWWQGSGVHLAVFRPLDSWRAYFQPGQLRRLHQKLCVVDRRVAFVGGINVIDDRNDLRHGASDAPRLDYAVELRGPVVGPVRQTAHAMWSRAALGRDLRRQIVALARSSRPIARAKALLRGLRITGAAPEGHELQPMRAAFVVRDNLRQRRSIERSYIEAFRRARHRIDLVSPYFYPGSQFRRTLRLATRRGVRVRLLLQGKLDYRIAGLAARSLYAELLSHGVEVHEYQAAFLHAKVALVDDDWATVGSSNIDPLSLLLNLEANVVVRDAGFTQELARHFEAAITQSAHITMPALASGWWGTVQRAAVAWGAYVYLRVAGITGKY